MTSTRERRIIYILAILLLLALAFVGYTGYRIFTQNPGEQTITSGGITVAKPSNNVVDILIASNGDLEAKYEDGTKRVVGNITGSIGPIGAQGEEGRPPTQAEIALAVVNYCADGRCDAKNPTDAQVATAVYSYCSTGVCKGDRGDTGASGTNGSNATAEMVMAAVTQYCQDGRCRGPQGEQGVAGQSGINGRSTVMACVIRTTNSLATRYVAWKYEDEANTAYRDLYKLPTWAEGSDCVDLRSA